MFVINSEHITLYLQNRGLPDDAITEMVTGLSEQIKEGFTEDIAALIASGTPLSETDMEMLENKIQHLLRMHNATILLSVM